MNLNDAVMAFTDRAMESAFAQWMSSDGNTALLQYDSLSEANLLCSFEMLANLADDLPDRFFLIGGSSNFHHLEISRLIQLHRVHGEIQLVLIDRHMDTQRYSESGGVVTCGNWVSCAVRSKLVSQVLLCGCDDERRHPGFDKELLGNTSFLNYQGLSSDFKDCLDPTLPTYISVDTDILDCSSDWGRGSVSLQALLKSPLWARLAQMKLVGAGVMGHVTDNRKVCDMLSTGWRQRDLLRLSPWNIAGLVDDLVFGLGAKIVAQFSATLPIEEQVEITLAIVRKIKSIKDQ